MSEEMSTEELRQRLDEGGDLVLLDVLTREAHEEWRIPGSRHACIYEMTFLDQIREAGIEAGASVVVYCSGPECRASVDAVARLAGAGFRRVRRYAGGREAWSKAGLEADGTRSGEPWQSDPARTLPDGRLSVDPESSGVDWVGRNPSSSRHFGTLSVARGQVEVEGGQLARGDFEVDMMSIEVGDLSGDLARLLVAHLESDDFFAVARFPTARFDLTRTAPLEEPTPGMPNLEVEGRLTLRGKTHPLRFRALVAPHPEGGVAMQANFDLDRTLWGALYGSGKLYHRLGMHLVNDLVTLQVRMVARPETRPEQ